MLTNLYALKDVKGGYYGNIFQEIQDVDAQRSFIVATRDNKSKVGQFPQDFELVRLGCFDNISGKVTILDQPVFLFNGVQAIALDNKIREGVNELAQKEGKNE